MHVKEIKTTNCGGDILGVVYTKRIWGNSDSGYLSKMGTWMFSCIFKV